uniref:Uncharacterized protein n=1 Tax=Oryza meridionalis TaxID=40149 RepID=A0A0E0EAF2_9ORYZ
MGLLAWMVAAAAAAVLASWAFSAVVHLVWRPGAFSRRLRAQSVGGPGYRFFSGNLGEIKRFRGDGAGVVLNGSSHDFLPIGPTPGLPLGHVASRIELGPDSQLENMPRIQTVP